MYAVSKLDFKPLNSMASLSRHSSFKALCVHLIHPSQSQPWHSPAMHIIIALHAKVHRPLCDLHADSNLNMPSRGHSKLRILCYANWPALAVRWVRFLRLWEWLLTTTKVVANATLALTLSASAVVNSSFNSIWIWRDLHQTLWSGLHLCWLESRLFASMQAFRKISTSNVLSAPGSLISLHSAASTAFASQIALRKYASDTKVLRSAWQGWLMT